MQCYTPTCMQPNSPGRSGILKATEVSGVSLVKSVPLRLFRGMLEDREKQFWFSSDLAIPVEILTVKMKILSENEKNKAYCSLSTKANDTNKLQSQVRCVLTIQRVDKTFRRSNNQEHTERHLMRSQTEKDVLSCYWARGIHTSVRGSPRP